MNWSIFASFFHVILTFNINPAEGITWLSEPLPVYKCNGQTANLTWEYREEPGEEIKQLQWIFNENAHIAYFSPTRGFNIEPMYQGRVNQSGQTGILLHNISAKDSGNYTLYPLIKLEGKHNVQTVQLNVIDPAWEPDCSCTMLSPLPEVRNGQKYQIMVGNCSLEINSSFCCPVGLVNKYCVNDPSEFCVPISNLVTDQSKVVNQERDSSGNKEISRILHNHTSLMISVLVILFIVGFSVIGVLIFFLIKYLKKRKNQKKTSTGKPESNDPQEFQSLHT